MRSKQAELIRDLTKLVGKYSARDWEPIVRLLRAGKSKIPELTAAIDELGSARKRKQPKQPAKKTPTKVGKRKTNRKMASKKSASKKKVIRSLSGRARQDVDPAVADAHFESWIRQVLSDVSNNELRELYVRVTGQKQIPPTREITIRELKDFAQHGSTEKRAAFISLLQRPSYDPNENFRRWARMISGEKKRAE